MATTSPDNIYLTTGGQPESSENESATQASSIQAAFDNRQGFSYVWNNASDRTSQTGMVQGSTGYQADTKSSYTYDGGGWRLALSYAEVTGSASSIPAGSTSPFSTLSLNSSTSTDTTFITVGANRITFVNPGVYSFFAYSQGLGYVMANGVFTAAGSTSGYGSLFAIGPGLAGTSMLSVPFYRTVSANQSIYFWTSTTAVNNTWSTIIRVGRLG